MPGRQTRLKLGTDQPGGKLRCPACNTPFALGSRTNSGATGMAELLAFELFEDHVQTDSFDIAEEKPRQSKIATKPAAPPAKPEPKPASKPTSRSTFKPAAAPAKPVSKKESSLLPDDLDLLGDDAPKPPAKTKPPQLEPKPLAAPAPEPIPEPEPEFPLTERSQSSILPDDFSGLDEKWLKLSTKQRPSNPGTEAKSKTESKNQPRPGTEMRGERESAAGPTPKKEDEFFLPANFDLGALAAPKVDPIPNLTLDDERPKAAPIYEDFEVIEPAPRVASDGVPLIEGVSDEEVAEIEQAEQEVEQARQEHEFRARNRAERRQKRGIRRTAAQAINAQVRGRWLMVFWGITFELAAVFCIGASLALVIVGLAAALFAAVIASGPLLAVAGIVWIIVIGLMAFSSLLDLIGLSLSIPCPAKNAAMIWAILSAVFGLAGIIGLLPLTLIGLIFYLLFLKLAAEALREYSLAQECVTLIKLVVVGAIASLLLLIFILVAYFLGAAGVFATKSAGDATNLGYVMGAFSLMFTIVQVILSGVIAYKFFLILRDFRHEIRWRLES